MYIDRLQLTNFRCFGPEPCTIRMESGLTAFVGANGTGKTAALQALLRLFGVTTDQRRVRRQDFHVPPTEAPGVAQRSLSIEAILAFPELDDEHASDIPIAGFFHHMAAEESGKLQCRLRLEATWVDDGSLDGAIEETAHAVRTFGAFSSDDLIPLRPMDRSRIQMIYVPAVRDGASQITAFLRGRLWRALQWSQGIRASFAGASQTLNTVFGAEPGVELIANAVTRRWREIHNAGTDTTPVFRVIDPRFDELVRRVAFVFHPDEAGRTRGFEELSDGQRSLFQIALTGATLDVEGNMAEGAGLEGFQAVLPLPALTLIAVEEPENNLAPFYLSRIVSQIEGLTNSDRAQAVISSHSASVLARVDPRQVRYFRLVQSARAAQVREITLPAAQEEAAKFVREAVRTYPELYFARYVILGEGSSEEVVLPRLSSALGYSMDRSFVAVVPLGGRHVNHLWRLLSDLEIPHLTLLDLDLGRAGGGWARIRMTFEQLLTNSTDPAGVFGNLLHSQGVEQTLAAIESMPAGTMDTIRPLMQPWLDRLRELGVYFCWPLDLDFSLFQALPDPYMALEVGMRGPSQAGDSKSAVLGAEGSPATYPEDDEAFRWYRYLFLGRGKPSTHVRVLSSVEPESLATAAPEELAALLRRIADDGATPRRSSPSWGCRPAPDAAPPS
jgi:putative ATP-dependent endonuclease of the OLD family